MALQDSYNCKMSVAKKAISHLKEDNAQGVKEAKEHNQLIDKLQSVVKKK